MYYFVFDTNDNGSFCRNLPLNNPCFEQGNPNKPYDRPERINDWYLLNSPNVKFVTYDKAKKLNVKYFYSIWFDQTVYVNVFQPTIKNPIVIRLHDYIENDINNNKCHLVLNNANEGFHHHRHILKKRIFEIFPHLSFKNIIFVTSTDDQFNTVDFKEKSHDLSIEIREQGWNTYDEIHDIKKYKELNVECFNGWERQVANDWSNSGRRSQPGELEYKQFYKSQLNYIKNKKNRKFYFTCYTRIPRYYRLLFLCLLSYNNLLNKTIWSYGPLIETHLYDVNNLENIYNLIPKHKNIYNLDNIAKKFINGGNKCSSDFNLTGHNHLFISYNDIYESYFNIVLDTDITSNELIMTEKCYKTIISLQFLLYLGNPFVIKRLRKDGYDMFDDFINHSYDEELDFENRLFLLLSEVNRLSNLSKKQINLFYKNNINRFIKNKENFFEHNHERYCYWEKYV